jgi:hypothetical protein
MSTENTPKPREDASPGPARSCRNYTPPDGKLEDRASLNENRVSTMRLLESDVCARVDAEVRPRGPLSGAVRAFFKTCSKTCSPGLVKRRESPRQSRGIAQRNPTIGFSVAQIMLVIYHAGMGPSTPTTAASSIATSSPTT